MHPSIENDLFYDLFGEQGFPSPESTGSTYQADSGHGSPFESTFDDSSPPVEFAWDADDHPGDFWESILDDLPSDITDKTDSNTGQQIPHQDLFTQLNTANGSYNKTLSWSTKVLEQGTAFDCNSNTINFEDGWNLHGSVFDNIKQEHMQLVNDDYTDDTNNVLQTTPIGTSDVTDSRSSQPHYDHASRQNEIQILSATPTIFTKPVSVGTSPTWIVKTCNQNGIAIIQNVDNDDNNIDVEDTKTNTDVNSMYITLNKKIRTSDKVVSNNEGNTDTLINLSDHDYADKDLSRDTQTTGVSQGMGPGLILTDEETKLLEKECLKLPEGTCLTKDEQKILKKVRRKIKNKQSAMESRRKRKMYIENLERRLMYCTDLSTGLKKKVEKLNKENKSLVNQLKVMKGFIAATFQQTKTIGTGTCLVVFLLTFSLCILPFNPLHFFAAKSETIPAESLSASPTTKFRSRTLLAIDDNTDYTDYYQDEFIHSAYSMTYEKYSYAPHSKNVSVHFENIGGIGIDYTLRTNFSMYVHHNFTWHIQRTSTSEPLRCTPTHSSPIRPTPRYTDHLRRTAAVSG